MIQGQLRRVGGGPGHMVQLDGLRAFAVTGVVFAHYGEPRLGNVIDPGGVGVRLFFVLSGFLITGILLDARAKAADRGVKTRRVLGAFYARRFLRIFPLYYFVLLSCVAINIPSARQNFPWHVAYLSNVLITARNSWLPAFGHFWSLSVEEQFYLLWPAVVLLAPVRRLGVILAGLILLGPGSRAVLAIWTHQLIQSTTLTPTCMDSLGVGGLVAYLWRYSWDGEAAVEVERLGRLGRRAAGVGALIFVVYFGLRGRPWAWTARVVMKDVSYALIFGAVVGGAARGFGGITKRVLEWRPLVYMGTISYGIYIYHDVLPLVDRVLFGSRVWRAMCGADRGWVPFLAVLSAATGVAAVSWHAFERPLNELKRYVPYVPAAREGSERETAAAVGEEMVGTG